MQNLFLTIALAPLFGSILAGLFGKQIGRTASHWVTISGVAVSCVLSFYVMKLFLFDGMASYNESVYTWLVSDGVKFEIGFLVDKLTAIMLVVVTFVSLMVHIYTIGYMKDDPGYQRFFSYIALFTFSMLMLVMSNNFLQLFFGWEAVGLVSYLLIGFWYQRDTAIFANLKAFLVNRVGDFGFLLGIAAVMMYTGSLDYATVFAKMPGLVDETMQIFPGVDWSVITVMGILLFVGAMGKSAQVPLHVWLPDSMEGPTPISALIHAATMVTAGIFMVARMSPIYEFTTTALTFILFIGAITALFMGFLGLIQTDIKRVVAYSTLSQLGYMTVALGASAYSAAIFHLMTHAFFKALLFLAAGAVIMAMHHEQDMRKMGGLRKYMPITYVTSLIGSLALIGFPGFAGFFSKDTIIEAVHMSTTLDHATWVHTFAYYAVLIGVFITALYSFRMFFMVFHGKERMDDHTREHLHECSSVVTIPLILLAIPSVLAGYVLSDVVFGNYFADAIVVKDANNVIAMLGENYTGIVGFVMHGLVAPAFWLAMGGLFTAWFIYMKRPDIADTAKRKLSFLYKLFENKYYMDDLYIKGFAAGGRLIGRGFWKHGDVKVIDGLIVNGSAAVINWFAGVVRVIQTGHLYHYAFVMILGLLGLLSWFTLRA